MSAMTYYTSYHIQEGPVSEDYSSLFSDSYDVAGLYEDCPPLLEALFYPCTPVDPDSAFQGHLLHDPIYSVYRKEEVYSANGPYDAAQWWFNNWKNWGNEYDSCFSLSNHWDDNLYSYDHGSGNGEDDNGLQKTEDSFQTEEQRYNNVTYYENRENQLPFEDSYWSDQETWFGYETEEDDSFCRNRESPYAYNYNADEMALCEAIFGYWPCMTQKQQWDMSNKIHQDP